MKDANVYLISNATVTASYNGSTFDFRTTPGSPMRGYEFTAYVTGNIVNGATLTNGVITYQFQDSPDTSFTQGPVYTEYQTVFPGTNTTGTVSPNAIPIPIKLQNRYGRVTVIPPTSVTISGLNVQLNTARSV